MNPTGAERRAGPEVTLEAMLEARERRVARREAAFARHPTAPVLTASVVMPGPVKLCGLSLDAQAAARAALDRLFTQRGWIYHVAAEDAGPTGPELVVSVEAEPMALKRALVALETSEPLGRLWDLDVAAPGGAALSRRDLGLPPRSCFVCGAPAHACARSRAHPIDELVDVLEAMIDAARPRD